MTPRFLIFLLALASVLRGDELAVKGIDLPLFDAAGHLVGRLKAVSATGTFDVPILKTGVVEFSSVQGAGPRIPGTLSFADATYDRAAGVIDSDHEVHLDFAQGTLDAMGFRYDLSTGRLLFRSAVVLNFPEAHVTAREGEILLSENPADRALLVSFGIVRGDVVVTEIKGMKSRLDRAETSSATYTGNDHMLTLAPTTTWTNGIKGVVSEETKFRVGGRSQESTPPVIPPSGATTKSPPDPAAPRR